jgi:L-ascorbate metabolism protein UlaG (beta-lactamase superfamily)
MIITRLSDSSWIKIKNKNRIVYFDPGFMGNFSNYKLPLSEFQESGDLILISHAHHDHLQSDLLEKIRKQDSLILCPAVCKTVIDKPFHLVKPGALISNKDIKIQVVNSYNTEEGSSTIKAHHLGEGVGYIVTWEQKTFYHGGDTDFIPEMKTFPSIDVAFLPIGGMYTMDISEAVEATLAIQPRLIIPMHFLNVNPEEFKRLVEQKSEIKVIVIYPGGSVEI